MDAKQPTAAPLIGFPLDDVWPILRKQRGVIALFFCTVVLATLVGTWMQTPEYRARSVIHLSPRTGQEVNVREVVDLSTHGYYEIQQFYRTQIQIILSRSVREEVVRRYNALGYTDLTLEADGANKLSKLLTVVPEEQSQLVTIAATHTDPVRAAELANLVAKVYEDQNLEARRDASANATGWLGEQLGEYAARVEEASRALHDFKAENRIVDVEERINTLEARIRSLNEAFGQKSTELVLLETTLAAHRDLMARGQWAELARVLESPLLQQASRDYATALAADADLAGRYGPRYPERLQAKARADALAETMRDEVRRLIDSERAKAEVVTRSVRSLEAEIESVKGEMLDYQRKADRFRVLRDELDQLKGSYQTLSRRLEEVGWTAQTQINNVRLVDLALPPPAPFKPNIPMSLLIACAVGVVGGLGLALLREYLDDTVSSQLDVTAHLKVPFLGLVPRLPEGLSSRDADLFTSDNPRSSVAEAVRGIRALIEMNPQGPPPKRILITSSVAREGKTGTTLRLAISFAQMGRRVVVIDADLRRPRLHKVFDAPNDVGLSSFVVGAATAEDLPVRTPVRNLSVVFAGPSSDHPAELLASPRMEELLTALEERFDVILLDTPPSVALSDAVILSRRVDGTVLVVKEQAVSRAVVRQTVGMFQQVEANILGVVLNHVDLQRSGSKYKYYYAYRDYYATYGDGQPPDDGRERAAK